MARQRSGRKTDYTWIVTSGAVTAQGATQQRIAVAVFNSSGTVMRVRGELMASMNGPSAADITVLGVGLIVATDAQVTAGAASFPSPLSVGDADWMWHGFVPLVSQGVVEDQFGNVGKIIVDTKAMRRVKPNEQLVLVADAVLLVGTATVDLAFGVRVLFGT